MLSAWSTQSATCSALTTIPGIAVGLIGLLAVLVAFGILQLTRYLLRPLLYSFAAVLRIVPVVGGFLGREVLKFERIVDSWLASAAVSTEKIATGFFHGLAALVSHLGTEIAGLAGDVYSAVTHVATVVVPRLLRAAETRILRVVHAVEARVVAAGKRIGELGAALGQRLLDLERRVQGAIGRAAQAVEHAVLVAVNTSLSALRTALHAIERAIAAAEFRIGRLEAQVFGAVWGELRRLGDDLRPDRLLERLLGYVWSIVPRELRTFLEWLWHLMVEFAHLLELLATGRLFENVDHSSGRTYLQETARAAEGLSSALRDVLGAGRD